MEEVAAAQLAVNCQIEHGEVANRIRVLKVYPDGPDILRLRGRLLTDEFALVPCFALLDGVHNRLRV